MAVRCCVVILEILKGADLSQLSAKKVRKQLEEKYDTELIDRYATVIV